jgi:hypothetical protein
MSVGIYLRKARACGLAIGAAGGLVGCFASLRPPPPNVLQTPPYDAVTYVAQPSNELDLANTVTAETRGYEATIAYTIPHLYDAAIHAFPNDRVFLSNIRLTMSSRTEPFQVAYQDCHSETHTEYVSQYQCTGYGQTRTCSTQMVPQMRTQQKCETKYRTEMRTVLYQHATGDVYRRRATQ